MAKDLVLSNLRTYLQIAVGASAESQRALEEGGDGRVIQLDPEQTSFKHALIAIAFAGIYLEALLYLIGTRKLGKDRYDEIDRKIYEDKLRILGINDQEILAAAKRLRETRNDLVHEKAAVLGSSEPVIFRLAQEEAKEGVELVRKIARLLGQPDH